MLFVIALSGTEDFLLVTVVVVLTYVTLLEFDYCFYETMDVYLTVLDVVVDYYYCILLLVDTIVVFFFYYYYDFIFILFIFY